MESSSSAPFRKQGKTMHLVSELISSFDPAQPNFRPTEIYNENWLVKIVMHQASSIDDTDYVLGFLPGSTWYSEGILPTAFKARFRGDPQSESRTHADCVIGHIRIGHKAKADLELTQGAKQFTVVEAKVGAPLSSGTSHAKYYDQAARNVACMAEVMARADVKPTSLSRLDFIVLAPLSSIDKGTFSKEMTKASIREKVKRRIESYDGQLDSWYTSHFEPALDSIGLHSLNWESAIEWISNHKPDVADQLHEYYELCLRYK